MERTIISYADITQPFEASPPFSESQSQSQSQSQPQPPNKKRKKSHSNNGKGGNKNPNGSYNTSSYNNTPTLNSNSKPNTKPKPPAYESNRELTHDEIWDDSALIEAWNAATEEYEAFHGSGKDWKNEFVHKSALWYNVPPKLQESIEENIDKDYTDGTYAYDPTDCSNLEQHEEYTEIPTNLDHTTSHATHATYSTNGTQSNGINGPHAALDPSSYAPQDLDPSLPMPTQDEAFSRALNAMYWGGYWTAVYHCQRKLSSSSTSPSSAAAGCPPPPPSSAAATGAQKSSSSENAAAPPSSKIAEQDFDAEADEYDDEEMDDDDGFVDTQR